MREASGNTAKKVKRKNNPRATIVEGVDTREPLFKRTTTDLVVWVETTQKSTGYCAVVVAAVVVRYGLRRAVYKQVPNASVRSQCVWPLFPKLCCSQTCACSSRIETNANRGYCTGQADLQTNARQGCQEHNNELTHTDYCTGGGSCQPPVSHGLPIPLSRSFHP